MQIRSERRRVGTINSLVPNQEGTGYERITNVTDEIYYYGVEIIDGRETIVTDYYLTEEEVVSPPSSPSVTPPSGGAILNL